MVITIVVLFVALMMLLYFFLPGFGKTTLELTSEPNDVEVVINNQIYNTPATVEIDPGKVTVWAFKEGYQEYKKDHNIKKGRKNKIFIQLNKSFEAEPPEGAPIN